MANAALLVGQNPPPLRTALVQPQFGVGRFNPAALEMLQGIEFLPTATWSRYFALLAEVTSGTAATVTPYTITYAATISPNYANGSIQKVVLTGNVTVNFPTNGTVGSEFTLVFEQDATGGRVITLDAGFKLGDALAYGAASTVTLIKGYFLTTTTLRITAFRQGDPV